MPFPYLDETRELDDSARKEAGGSFIKLTDGITHYELRGPESGQLIVLVHGFSVPYFIFDPTFEFLTQAGFRVLRYDLFGRGYSDRPRMKYDIHLFVRQLRDLLDALNLKDITLLGLSMGGTVTASFIARYPEVVRRHVLIDPAGVQRIQISILLEATKLPIFGELVFGLFGSGSMIKSLASDIFDKKLVEHFQTQYKIQMQFKGFKRAILSSMRSGMLDSFYETYERVGSLKKPTLLFWGRNDTTTPFGNSDMLVKAMPHAEFHAVDDCSHIPHYERPEVVNPILLKFLS
ncbi:MAG: alpha/beta hydrolase [Chloroflexi bacterium]|nr:alpha/beta hydrolase [Chloroflexota bacterium]